MDSSSHKFINTVLFSAAGYFALCGISAIFYPISWLVIANLPVNALSNELRVVFGALGAYMLALGLGALIAALGLHRERAIILVLIIANLLDFAVTLHAVVEGLLPIINGGAFLMVAMTWSVLLSLVYLQIKRGDDQNQPTRE